MAKSLGGGRYRAKNGKTYATRAAAVRADRFKRKTSSSKGAVRKRARRRKKRYQ